MLKIEKFIEKAKKKHGNKYDYSKVEYINSETKVCIVCPTHGEFWQKPAEHVRGCGCPYCANNKKLTTEEFIERARKIHGDKYDYSKVEYINSEAKVCIICPKHGEFWQTPSMHLNENGCPYCANNKKLTTEEFIERAKQIHGDKYDYSKVEYVNSHAKVCIICPKHGEFWQRPNDHLNGYGCPLCGNEYVGSIQRDNKDKFIEKAKKVHGDKYDYSKVEYINSQTKVCIICPKHGEFWQAPAHHLQNNGCPKCVESTLEKKVRVFLEENKIKYEPQKKFVWLKNRKSMKLDFYLPEYNVAIECQGIQHYKPIDFANKGKEWANELYKYNKKRDKLKKQLCEKNCLKLIYFKYNDKINTLKDKIL